MGRLRWTSAALADVRRIRVYVAAERPVAATRLAQRLLSAGDSLQEQAHRGRPISRDRRELAITPPYLIRYRIVGDDIIILEVRHGARAPD